MNLENSTGYKKSSKLLWQGRCDGEKALRLHETMTFNELKSDAKNISFLGFACDEGVRRNLGNPGAAEGPDALRKALANLPIPHSKLAFNDFGTVFCQNSALEQAQKELANIVKELISAGALPILLGGGHEVAWANYQGIAAALPTKNITTINFDAHFDLRPMLEEGKGSSGTSFTQISNFCSERNLPFEYVCLGIQEMSNTSELFERADLLKVKSVLAEEFHCVGIQVASELLEDVLLNSEAIHLTICLDVFASAYAPGVSAPQSLGLTPWQVIPLLRQLAISGKVVSLDIAELCPQRDPEGRTAHLAAGLVYHFLNNLDD